MFLNILKKYNIFDIKLQFKDLFDTNEKFKGLIWYLKNLKHLSDANVKLKASIDAFWKEKKTIVGNIREIRPKIIIHELSTKNKVRK
jgi:hypothetical protein